MGIVQIALDPPPFCKTGKCGTGVSILTSYGENPHYVKPGVSIFTSYGENPHYVKLPIFSEFMENSEKFMKNSGLTKWTQNLR